MSNRTLQKDVMSDEAIDEVDTAADPDVTAPDLIDDLVDDSPDPHEVAASHGRWAVPVCAAVAAVALVFAVISALSWWAAVRDSASTDAAARDAVLSQTRIDVATVNTVDFHDPATSLQHWSA